MKKIVIACFVFCCFVSISQAQEKGDLRFGAGFLYGTEIEELGINLGAEYLITEKISVAPSYSIFFTPDPVSFNVFNIDGRYYFMTGDGPQLYGLLGFASASSKVDVGPFGTFKATDSGINLGGGIVYPLGGGFGINGQLKYSTPGDGQFVFQGGVVYTIKTGK